VLSESPSRFPGPERHGSRSRDSQRTECQSFPCRALHWESKSHRGSVPLARARQASPARTKDHRPAPKSSIHSGGLVTKLGSGEARQPGRDRAPKFLRPSQAQVRSGSRGLELVRRELPGWVSTSPTPEGDVNALRSPTGAFVAPRDWFLGSIGQRCRGVPAVGDTLCRHAP
jgi:hypothetical protein